MNMTLNSVHEVAPIVSLEQADGQSVSLDRLWQERTVVLVFLRHFG